MKHNLSLIQDCFSCSVDDNNRAVLCWTASNYVCAAPYTLTITPHAVAVNRSAIWFASYQHAGFHVATHVVILQGDQS